MFLRGNSVFLAQIATDETRDLPLISSLKTGRTSLASTKNLDIVVKKHFRYLVVLQRSVQLSSYDA